jgi:hypothetical protein
MDMPDPQMVAIYRRMTPPERILAGLAATEMVRDRLRAHLGHLHPDWDREAIEAAVAERLLRGHDGR